MPVEAMIARPGRVMSKEQLASQVFGLDEDASADSIEIYVHRQGVKPVGFHIARLLDRNPRTPFRIELALHNLHTTLYGRYVAHQLAACRAPTARE